MTRGPPEPARVTRRAERRTSILEARQVRLAGGTPNANFGGAGGTGAAGEPGETGGAGATGGDSLGGTASGGSEGDGGSVSMAGSSSTGGLGAGVFEGSGTTKDRYAQQEVLRDGIGYVFIANGWGENWQSHEMSYDGTSFTVKSLLGTQGPNYAPAGYPTMFCGQYSEPVTPAGVSCGLPADIASPETVKTGWRWKANGNTGQYNAAWDIWLGNGNTLSAYLMVWLRDPPGQQPAGSAQVAGASIDGLPGQWTIFAGTVNGHPIVNYVRAEGQDLSELEFDVMKVYADAKKSNLNLPGSKLLSVAIGFEVWNGPVTNLVTEDFYVAVD